MALLLTVVAGYGPACLLLPASVRPWFWLAVPVVGLAVLSIAFGWLNLLLPMRWAAPVALAVLFALGGYCLIRRPAARGAQSRAEQLAVAGLMAVALVLCLGPALSNPALLSIGRNWDVEIYLPLAEYLKLHPLGFGIANPAGVPFSDYPNPLLWRVNFFDVRWSGLAFQSIHAAVGVLAGQAAHHHFAALIAVCYALFVAAAFLVFRAAFAQPRGIAIAVTALVSVNAGFLYVAYWSFGQQAVALPLLALALLTGVVALREPSRPHTAMAGLALAALLAAYATVLPLYALAFGFGVVATGYTARNLTPLRVAAGVGAVSLILAPWAYLRGIVRVRHLFDERGVAGLTVGPDVTDFPLLGWGFGLYTQPSGGLLNLLPPGHPAELVLGGGVQIVILGLLLLGAVSWYRTRQWLPLALGLAPIALLLALRYGSPYPYGFLKAMASGGFLLVGLAAAGAQAVWGFLPAKGFARWARGILVAAGILYLGLTALNAFQTTIRTSEVSEMAFRDLERLAAQLPPGATVYLAGGRDLQGPRAGALAYFLRRNDLYGYLRTGFSTFYRPAPPEGAAYAVFPASDMSQPELYPVSALLWEGQGLRLYRRQDGAVAFTDFGRSVAPPIVQRSAGQGAASGLRIAQWRADGYPDFAGWSPPLLGVLAETSPPETRYPLLARSEPVDLPLPASALGARYREVVLTLAAFTASEVTVVLGEQTAVLTVQPGLISYPFSIEDQPSHLTVTNQRDAPVYAKSVLVRTARQSGGPQRATESALTRWESQRQADGLDIALDYLGPGQQLVLDVYSADGGRHYGYWSLPPGAAGGPRSYRLRLDTKAGALYLGGNGAEQPLAGWQGERAAGAYQAYLVLWNGDRALRSVPLFRFLLDGAGQLTAVEDSHGLSIG